MITLDTLQVLGIGQLLGTPATVDLEPGDDVAIEHGQSRGGAGLPAQSLQSQRLGLDSGEPGQPAAVTGTVIGRLRSHGRPAQRTPRGWLTQAASWLMVVLLLGGVGVGAAWYLTGGRWAAIETGSMGTAAPVGTLVWLRPVSVSDLHPGQIITYQPPVHGMMPHTHRVISVHEGAVRTQGDVNGTPDPWVLHQRDIVGVVVARWWAMAYLVRALPFLALGSLALFVLRRYLPQAWRPGLWTAGIPMLVAIVSAVVHPFLGASVITTTRNGGMTSVWLTSTGIFPVQVSTLNGTSIVLYAGQVGSVRSPATIGQVPLTMAPHLSPTWAAVVGGICAVPLLCALGHAIAHTRGHTSPRT